MDNDSDENGFNQKKIFDKLNNFETRISKLEVLIKNKISIESEPDETYTLSETELVKNDNESGFESRIGEFGLGWLGTIVLLFGISFVTQYLQTIGYVLFSNIFGYTSVIGIFFISNKLKNSYSSLSNKLNVISFLLLYYITLKLHFFTLAPVIENKFISLTLLFIVVGIHFYFSIKNKSEFKTGIAYLLLIFSSYISDTTHLLFSLVIAGSIITVWLFYKYGWWKLTLFSIFFTYISFIFFLMNNHLLMSESKTILSDNYSIIYLLSSVSVFSLLTLIKPNDLFPSAIIFICLVLNGLFFSLILLIYIFTFYIDNYIGIFISISAFCLIFSIILKFFSEWKYTPALYALYSFVSISIVVYGIYNFPYSYLLLSIQSLLVVSLAIWYRSKIIVVMNFMLFVLLLFSYILTSKSIDSINISFALVPLASARIINWQKERLVIKTDLLRNIYLIITFFCVLYALLKFVPDNYVTLSWSIAAVSYFLLSLILHNVKYRWMAISTMIATAMYLFLVDLARVEVVFRIIAFMVLAVISISVSIYYARRKKKKENI